VCCDVVSEKPEEAGDVQLPPGTEVLAIVDVSEPVIKIAFGVRRVLDEPRFE